MLWHNNVPSIVLLKGILDNTDCRKILQKYMGLLDYQPLIHTISRVLKGSSREALSLSGCLHNTARPGPGRGTCSGGPRLLPLRNKVNKRRLLQNTYLVHN